MLIFCNTIKKGDYMGKILNNIKIKINNIITKLTHKNMWKMYLYYKNQLVNTMYVNEEEQVLEKIYIINVKGKKHLFGTNKKVNIVVKPICLKHTDTTNKKVYFEVIEYEGVRLND